MASWRQPRRLLKEQEEAEVPFSLRQQEDNDEDSSSQDDDDDDQSSYDSKLTGVSIEEPRRDEVQEILQMSKNDTDWVRGWRLAVAILLLATALAVTLTTHRFLVKEQAQNYETAYEQLSRTVRQAALAQQEDIRAAYVAMATTIAALAQATNATWPFWTVPRFELYARHFLKQAHGEIISIQNLIEPGKQRLEWEAWAAEHYQEMVYEGHYMDRGDLSRLNTSTARYKASLWNWTSAGPIEIPRGVDSPDRHLAFWSVSPPPTSYGLLNMNLASLPGYDERISALFTLKNETLVSGVRPYKVSVDNAFTKEEHDDMHSRRKGSDAEYPHSFYVHPVHQDALDYESKIVAILAGGIAWDAELRHLLPIGADGIYAVLQNDCNQTYTYEIDGPEAYFLGEGDLHEKQFNDKERSVNLALHTNPAFPTTPGHCQFSLHIYPSTLFMKEYDTKTPEIFAIVVAAAFVLVAAVFFVYNCFVQRRNERLIVNAARSNAIVSSMFPEAIRDRLLVAGGSSMDAGGLLESSRHGVGGLEGLSGTISRWSISKSLRAYMIQGIGGGDQLHQPQYLNLDVETSKPLADLFLETTVLFADISGFTAWSSVREPSQVFTLLETIYASFDALAHRRRVFKVETVGDCYVAVTGLPEFRPDHSICMARFAQDIIFKMSSKTKELETTLGPDTGELDIRVGLHSGPVTAGVLRGERSRFQLFGDTMNTASRMESTGERGRIQCSSKTAQLLEDSGKGSWLEPRLDTIDAKGKGIMNTFWVNVAQGANGRSSSHSASSTLNLVGVDEGYGDHDVYDNGLAQKAARLVDWNVVQLLRLIRQIVARRNAMSVSQRSQTTLSNQMERSVRESGLLPLQEVKEIIRLPKFDSKVARRQQDPDLVVLPPSVEMQLKNYVTYISSMYRENPFHNFYHCSHVAMSVTKLMSRINAPAYLEDEDLEASESKGAAKKKVALSLHDHTYGITSDPLTQFACVFSALIHDVDHTGVPNSQLIEEDSDLATYYNNRSVAEQNSLDIAWDLLMEDRYAELRNVLYTTEAELLRFRSLVVNSVMATDIVDKELKALRNARWDKAFKDPPEQGPRAHESTRDAVNRKATIVIEHLIQASDVAHTMQHWHVYRKWNEKLFRELHRAYRAGRAEKDPAEFWYKGEIGFFDFYIIPLAKKLKDCGVFGKSSDEYLNYAISNRQEWEQRGEAVVAEMVEKINRRIQQRGESCLLDGARSSGEASRLSSGLFRSSSMSSLAPGVDSPLGSRRSVSLAPASALVDSAEETDGFENANPRMMPTVYVEI